MCPLHSPRALTTVYRKTKRELSKKLLHLPEAWADRWADNKTEPTEVVNQARIQVDNIRADAAREIAYFPRDWKAQHECDIMYERDFALVVAGKVRDDDLWSNFLVLNRKARLTRMHAAKIRLRSEARAPNACTATSNEGDVVSTKKDRTYRVTKVRAMLPGNYVVTGGRDRHDRLIVRARDDVYDGHYVHQHGGELCQNPDPFHSRYR